MRTVLAVDEILGRAIADRISGEKIYCTRERMREEGDDVARRLVLEKPSVLIIGGTKWNPLRLLERWRLPYETPVVLLLRTINFGARERAKAIRVFSVIPADYRAARVPTCAASEALLAHAWMEGIRPRATMRVVRRVRRTPPSTRRDAPILRLAR